jgi:predicted amidohydrolase YtcJ
VGWGYDDTLLAEKRHPTRDVLDAVSQEHPIVLWHVSGHLAAANGLALERVGISADTPDPEGGRIRRDPRSGEPDGVLEESASDPLQGGSRPSFLDALRIVRAGSALYLRVGVTTVQSGYTLERYMRGLTWLSRLGVVAPRLVLWPGDELAQRMLDGSFSYTSYDERWVRLGAAKLLADGSIQGYTGYLSQPYHVPPGDDPAYRGYPRIPREELIEKVARRHAAGWQVAVHGNGDAAIDDILDAFEHAQRQHPRADARHVVIHAQMAREDQLDRMKALGVIPSFFSLHTYPSALRA